MRGYAIPENCKHQFGYLSRRSKEEEIPEECLLCEKLLECMRFEPESKFLPNKPESADTLVKSDLLVQETETQTPNEAEISNEKSTDNAKMEPLPVKSPENQFIVENLGMMYASWTNTARIDEKILSEWGGKVKEIQIETADGRIAQCRVKSMKKSKGRVIQIPDKIQTKLKIKSGETVVVKPAEGFRKENRITDMITDYTRSILTSALKMQKRAQ